MQYFWRHPLAEEVREEGRREGRARERARYAKAEVVLRNLQWRGIDVPDAVRDRVLASTGMTELSTWLDRSYEVTDVDALFGEAAG